MDFPKKISEEDRQLWFKELRLSGELHSWRPAIHAIGPDSKDITGPDIWELETENYIVKYERVANFWEMRGEPMTGAPIAARWASKFILEDLRRPSLTSEILPPIPIEDKDA